MTTPAKQYQNVSYKELITYSENNPNRNRTLESIEIHVVKPTQETSLEKLGLKGYTAVNLNPSGILSLLVCINDPAYYSLAAKNARLQLIIDLATKLQQQTDDLKNTSLSRKRKKIHDLIGAAYNGSTFEEKEYFDLFNGISLMANIQFILMKSAVQEDVEEGEKQYDSGLKGEVIFSSDPVNWKSDVPVWVADYRARWVAVPTDNIAQPLHKIAATWLSSIEQNGWIIKWPEIEATKTELVEQLSLLPTWQVTDKKLTKDVLSARLGRAKSIKVFTKWMMNETSDDI
jgi:hypothetical protein